MGTQPSKRSRTPLVAIGGYPSPATIFAIHCMTEMLARIGRSVDVVPFNQINRTVISHVQPNREALLFFDVPDAEARAALRDFDGPVCIIAEDFATTVSYSMAARSFDFVQAVRLATQSFAALTTLRRATELSWIQVNLAESLPRWFERLASILGLAAEDWIDVREAMLVDYAPFPSLGDAVVHFVHGARDVDVQRARLSEQDGASLDLLAAAYDRIDAGLVNWPSNVLLAATSPYPPVSGPLDLTGPARLLVFGPYFHLPPGRWTADFEFDAARCESGNMLEFDAIADGEIKCSERVLLRETGSYRLRLRFAVQEPALAVECRCLLAEGALDGHLQLKRIQLQHGA